jgi:hypothetical protein
LYAIRWRPVLVGYEALLVGFSVKPLIPVNGCISVNSREWRLAG